MQLSIYRNINFGEPNTPQNIKYVAYTLPQPHLVAEGWIWLIDSFFLSSGDTYFCSYLFQIAWKEVDGYNLFL